MPRTAHAMNHAIRRFKSLTVALKELERFVRSGKPLQSGRPFKNFGGMLPREAWANWLLCAVANAVAGTEQFTFTTDPVGGDGVARARPVAVAVEGHLDKLLPHPRQLQPVEHLAAMSYNAVPASTPSWPPPTRFLSSAWPS